MIKLLVAVSYSGLPKTVIMYMEGTFIILKKGLPIIIVLGMGLPISVWGGDTILKTAGKVLQIGIGAEAAGMGEAHTAVADDVYALYWNPAGLTQIKIPQVSYMHNFWLGEIQHLCASYAHPLQDGGIGINASYFNFGEFEKIDVDPNGYPLPLDEKFSPYTVILSAGYGSRLWLPGCSLGGTLKMISENIDTFSSVALAVDLGLQTRGVIKNLDAGVMIRNLGMSLEGYNLPLNLRLGLAYNLIDSQKDGFRAVVDLEVPFPLDQPFYTNLGLEYKYLGILAGRVGYKISEINQSGNMAGLAAGVSVYYRSFSLDYAFLPFGALGTTHRISFTAGFESQKGKKPAVGPVKPKKKVRKQTTKPVKKKAVPKDKSGQEPLRETPELVEVEGLEAMDEVLVPKIAQLAERKAIQVKVESVLYSREKTKIKKAVFKLEVRDRKQVKHWGMKILDGKGRPVKGFSGEGFPGKIKWEGKDRKGKALPETIFCTYEFEVLMKDGTVEHFTGKVVDQAVLLAREETREDAAEAKLPLIYFEEGSYDLRSASIKILKNAAKQIKSRPYIKIIVEGHTDSGSEKEGEFLLSQKRGDSVVRYLAATYKITLRNVNVRGRGSKHPVASNQTAAGRKKNRRVEITIIYRK